MHRPLPLKPVVRMPVTHHQLVEGRHSTCPNKKSRPTLGEGESYRYHSDLRSPWTQSLPFLAMQWKKKRAARRSQSSGTSKAVSSVCKQVILLSDPRCDSVPRQLLKTKLIEERFVLNAFLLDKQWPAP